MTEDEAKEYIAQEVRRQMELAGRVIVVPAKEVLRQEFQRRAVDSLLQRVSTALVEGLPYETLRYMLAHDEAITAGRIAEVMSTANPNAGKAIKTLTDAGLIAKVGGGGNGVPVSYRPCLGQLVADALRHHNPTEADVDQTYQAVLGRIAGVSA